MQKLVNFILSTIDDEIANIQQSYSSPPAKDYAEYMRRVGEEEGLRRARSLLGDAYKKWVKDDDGID